MSLHLPAPSVLVPLRSSLHLPPEIWGPLFWSTFHIVSLGYPESPTFAEKRAAKEFFNSMIFLLPCPVCKEHFSDVLKTLPVETWLDNRSSLTEWVWMLHNRVNARLGKPEISKSAFFGRYVAMAERGLPIPPSTPMDAATEAAEQAAWIRGAATTLGTVAVVGAIGGLLWVSYSGRR